MKRLLIILCAIFTFSCSNDNVPEPVAIEQEKIIGNWTNTKTTFEYEDGTTDTNIVTGCNLQDKLVINADGTFEEINFDLNIINNNCIQTTSGFTGSKIWSKATNGNYFFNAISTNPNYDSSTRFVISALFQNNTMTLRFKETNADPSDTNPVIFYNETYQKN